MKISLTKCGKRFNRDWIFRNLSFEFIPGQSYAITGPNGSGKSTLLQVIGGGIVTSEGRISYLTAEENEIPLENAFQYLALAAPYLEVIEEMTLKEFFHFHQQFKPFQSNISAREVIDIIGLSAASDKQIRYYSSGMKQRVKLAQAIFSDVSCLLLDEPCTNLDDEGIALYSKLIDNYGNKRTIIVSSNDKQEYEFCEKIISIADYK